MRYTTDTMEYSTPKARVGDASGGMPIAASIAIAFGDMYKRSGVLRAVKGRKSQKQISQNKHPTG